MPTRHVNAGSVHELQQIADDLGKSRKVIVVTGAGISTNCGIPVSRTLVLISAREKICESRLTYNRTFAQRMGCTR